MHGDWFAIFDSYLTWIVCENGYVYEVDLRAEGYSFQQSFICMWGEWPGYLGYAYSWNQETIWLNRKWLNEH